METAVDITGSEDDEAFFDAMTGDRDPLVFVIKAAAYIEREIYRLLHALAVSPKAIDDLDLELSGAITLSVAFGLDPTLAVPLRSLATVRNRFAHRTEATLGAGDVRNLWKTLAEREKTGFSLIWRRLRPDASPLPRVDDPAEAFCFMAVCLRAAVTAERLRLIGLAD